MIFICFLSQLQQHYLKNVFDIKTYRYGTYVVYRTDFLGVADPGSGAEGYE